MRLREDLLRKWGWWPSGRQCLMLHCGVMGPWEMWGGLREWASSFYVKYYNTALIRFNEDVRVSWGLEETRIQSVWVIEKMRQSMCRWLTMFGSEDEGPEEGVWLDCYCWKLYKDSTKLLTCFVTLSGNHYHYSGFKLCTRFETLF